MRKILIIYVASFFIALLAGRASYGAVHGTGVYKECKVPDGMAVSPRFHVGKRLVYLMRWNGIPVGRIIAEAGNIIEYNGRDVYVVKAVTVSNKFLSKLYRVEDTFISYIDADTMTSLRFECIRKEGKHRKHLVIDYDAAGNEAIYTDIISGGVEKCFIEGPVHDPLSSLCYFMTLTVSPGDNINIPVNFNQKNYKLSGDIKGVRILDLKKTGVFTAFKLKPYVELEGKKVRKARGWMYFSADEDRYPLYGVIYVPFGVVSAKLISIDNI